MTERTEKCEAFLLELCDDLRKQLTGYLALGSYAAGNRRLIAIGEKLIRWMQVAIELRAEFERLKDIERRYQWRPITELEDHERPLEFASNGVYLGRVPWLKNCPFRIEPTHFREGLEPPVPQSPITEPPDPVP